MPTYLHVNDPVPNSMAVQVHGGVHGEDSLVATRTEQVKCCQSLVCLLQSLTGARTTIELRNEITVEGTVTSVDLHMNTIVVDATFRKLNGEEIQFERLFIHGNQIRYVHIPEGVDVMRAIESRVDELLHGGGGGSGASGRAPKNSYSKRRRMRSSRVARQREERDAARAFRLGRGRGLQQEGH